jgi:ABC-2 type transport system permease protein
MWKIYAAAVREYKVTALTPAFFIGAVVVPAVIWGLMFVVGATGILSSDKPPMEGKIAVVDSTENARVAASLAELFSPEGRERAREAEREALERMLGQMPEELRGQLEGSMPMVSALATSGSEPSVDIVPISPDGADLEALREAVRSGDYLALIVVSEQSIRIPIPTEDGGAPTVSDPNNLAPSRYRIDRAPSLDPDYLGQIQQAVHRSIQDLRYEQAGIDPATVMLIAQNAPSAITTLVTQDGDTAGPNAELVRFLPFIFMMLIYASVLTGGNYLLMGTLEEKGSRVMEVLLSAVSPTQLLIGKLIGQGLVGLTVVGIYGGVGIAAANQFNYLAVLPSGMQIVWMALYFFMAYFFLGAMMVAVGAAVTELREAQALYAPITFSLIVPFVLMFAIMDNPGGMVARIFSFFPPTTPFVMVMRLSQPSHTVPLWEIGVSMLVGFAGVALMVWIAAKIFRIGVLRYGKPPTLVGLLKWVREA